MARFTIDLPDKVAAELDELTEDEGRTKIEMIRRAIHLYARLKAISGDTLSVSTDKGQKEIFFI